MKLKAFVNTRTRPSECTMRMSLKTGLFTFTKSAKEKIGIDAEKDKIMFFQDEESPKDWFVCKSKEGFTVRTGSDDTTLHFNASTLKEQLRKTHQSVGTSVLFHIGGETVIDGVNYYPLLLKRI